VGIITVSREFASGGEAVARLVADKLGFFLVDHKEVNAGLAEYGIGAGLKPAARAGEGQREMEEDDEDEEENGEENGSAGQEDAAGYLEALQSYLRKQAAERDLVVLGRGANFILSDFSPLLRIRIVCTWKKRVERAIEEYGLGREAAAYLLHEQDRKKDLYFRETFKEDWNDVKAYDLVINTGTIALEKAVYIITAAYRLQEQEQPAAYYAEAEASPGEITSTPHQASFMHPSEKDFAKMLDFYRVRWEYEPRTFILEWDREGNIQEAFSPDFYLPDYDLYLELTTQKQQLGWKKNKKIRRLKELYPHINIKLINKKGFQSLLQKFSMDR